MNEHIQYQRKVSYYSKLSENVLLRAPDHLKAEKYYLPAWTNDSLWGKWHAKESASPEQYRAEKFKNKFPTPESFKNFCFKEAERDQQLNECSNGWGGWCEQCLWSPSFEA